MAVSFDGIAYCQRYGKTATMLRLIFSVKSGGVSVETVATLRGEWRSPSSAAMAVFITRIDPTKPIDSLMQCRLGYQYPATAKSWAEATIDQYLVDRAERL